MAKYQKAFILSDNFDNLIEFILICFGQEQTEWLNFGLYVYKVLRSRYLDP